MKALFSNMKLSYKLLLSNVLYLLVLGVVFYFVINTHWVIETASEKQGEMTSLSENYRNAVMDVRDYLNSQMTYEELFETHGAFIENLVKTEYGGRVDKIMELLDEYKELAGENSRLKEEIRQLAATGIQQSDTYIKENVSRLADETSREEVTYLERLVIQGAHENTANNLKLLIYLEQLNVGNSDFEEVKATLLDMTGQTLERVEADIKSLVGTPFAELPVQAKASAEKAVANIKAIVQNVEAQQKIQATIIRLMLESISKIDSDGVSLSYGIFKDIESRLMELAWILTIAIAVAVGLGLFISGKTSRILKLATDGLNEGSKQVASTSGQISSSIQQLAAGASEQAASIEETSSSLEEMSAMTKQNAENAGEANSLMKDANQVVAQANDAMIALTTSMEEIIRASEETFKIIKTIDEIAFQTNLLALNAAVEAARAGEAGAGFAVVAEEVRNLAMRAAEASKNTADLIQGTVKRVKDGSELLTKTNDAFAGVAGSTSKVGELVDEIAAASNEQADGIEQINLAVGEMDKVVQQNSANAEESATASEEMNAQAMQMQQFVADLMVIVGGNKNGNGGGGSQVRSIPERTLPTRKKVKAAAIAPKWKIAEPVPKGVEVDPEKLISIKDDSFTDF